MVPDGEALRPAVALAGEIASFPWRGVVNDRRASTPASGSALAEALAIEDELGRDTIFADGFRDGVDRFDDHQASRARPLTRSEVRGSRRRGLAARPRSARCRVSGVQLRRAPVVALHPLAARPPRCRS